MGLQPNHSEYMRLVATLADEKSAEAVYREFIRHLGDLFARGERFRTCGFTRGFKTRKDFLEWKKKEWDPVADQQSSLTVQRRKGRIRVCGNHRVILDDWSREQTEVALDGSVIALSVYTAGYGLDHVEDWLSERGAHVTITVQGGEYAYRCIDDALKEVEAPARKERPRRVRAGNGHDRPAGPKGDR
jgi:hypothetical protein